MSMMNRIPVPGVAALVGEFAAAGHAPVQQPQVRPYAFGAGEPTGIADFCGLRAINDRFCRLARSAFVPTLRFPPRITCLPPELLSFDEFRGAQDRLVSLTVCHVEELRGSLLMVLPHRLVSTLTNAWYGGGPVASQPGQGEFSATEERLIEQVTARLMQAMQLAWRDVMPISLSVIAREANMRFASFAVGDEMVVCCRFQVELLAGDAARIDVLYPLQLLKPIAGLLRARLQSDQLDEDRSWREKLEQAVLAVPLRVSVRLCQPEMPLNRLMSLATDEVLPVTLSGSVDVLVEGRALFAAQPGEQSGRAAVAILRPLTP
jgi:flagellar motor switch protein FliM